MVAGFCVPGFYRVVDSYCGMFACHRDRGYYDIVAGCKGGNSQPCEEFENRMRKVNSQLKEIHSLFTIHYSQKYRHQSKLGIMLKNYFKTALRNLFRNKLYTTLNIAGLTF